MKEVLSRITANTFAKDEAADADDIPGCGDFSEAVEAVRVVVAGCNLSATDFDLLESALEFLNDLEKCYKAVEHSLHPAAAEALKIDCLDNLGQ